MNKRFPATCQDRESAVGLLGRLARLDSSYAHFDDIALRISEGGHDDSIWVQVFAAHRLSVTETLRKALDPFAVCCDQIDPREDDEEWAKFRLLVADYRRARAAIAEQPA